MARAQTKTRATRPSDALLTRARGEYLEMPGLSLTVAQACRLWQLDTALCVEVFAHLVSEGYLRQTARGVYVASRRGAGAS
ncbi:MAG: hypothetical protein AB7H88_21080 [Vicinamibacterales bacterium]